MYWADVQLRRIILFIINPSYEFIKCYNYLSDKICSAVEYNSWTKKERNRKSLSRLIHHF